MKKVFSLEKFIQERCSGGGGEETINGYISGWPKECVGLTSEEMNKLGWQTSDDWMIEVEEDNKVTLDVEINTIVDGLIKDAAGYIELTVCEGICSPLENAELINALANLLKARRN